MNLVRKAPACIAVLLQLLDKGRDPRMEMLFVKAKLLAKHQGSFDWDIDSRVISYVGPLRSKSSIDALFQEFIYDYYCEFERLAKLSSAAPSIKGKVISENVRRLRKEKGYTQFELDANLGRGYKRLTQKIERQEFPFENITMGSLVNLAQALQVDIEDLLMPKKENDGSAAKHWDSSM